MVIFYWPLIRRSYQTGLARAGLAQLLVCVIIMTTGTGDGTADITDLIYTEYPGWISSFCLASINCWEIKYIYQVSIESVMKSDSASIDLASANTGYFEKRFFSLGCITIDCVCSTQFIRFYFHCSILQKCWAGSCSTFALQVWMEQLHNIIIISILLFWSQALN